MTLATYGLRTLPAAIAGLVTLALDLRWSWHHGSDQLWQALDKPTWDHTHNAWWVVNNVSEERLEALAADPEFLALYRAQWSAHESFLAAPTWYSEEAQTPLGQGVAWFSMEYGISESLPLYSGGLGVLAGDYLKAASDLGVPMVAVGLLYQQGYFRQALSERGEQLELYPFNDPTLLPVAPLRNREGEWASVTVPLPGRLLRLRAWQVRIGRVDLYLLDSNDPRNHPGDRGITSELYGGGPEKRLQQELALGVGGWRVIAQLGREPAVCHINEGHCAFALAERAFHWQRQYQTDFATAHLATRATHLFTTHTSVTAGFDRFPTELARWYLTPWLSEYGESLETLLTIANGGEADLNMAGLALGFCGAFNGVSQVHQQVTQRMFQPWFARWPAEDIPAGCVTNGVHTPSWDGPESDALWTKACGKDRWRHPLPGPCPLEPVADEELWAMRRAQRARLIHYLNLRSTHPMLDPETLTLGFARRFTAYKRPDLLLHQPERLVQIITSRDRPVQMVLAGKAHPKDTEGKAMIARWNAFAARTDVRGRVVFVPDYDLSIASQLIQGADVWLNCPRHPWEACGTSGMKVLVNGGLNVSQHDGWWAEAWNPAVGWAIRPCASLEELAVQDAEADRRDAESLYQLLEQQVIPEFYELGPDGAPYRWLARMRASMDSLTPRYSANRMVREYVTTCYGPMIEFSAQRTPKVAKALTMELQELALHWPKVRFERLEVNSDSGHQRFRLQLYLNGIPANRVWVELVAEASSAGPRQVTGMTPSDAPGLTSDHQSYHCTVPARPDGHYTPRVRLQDSRLALPLEAPWVHWYR